MYSLPYGSPQRRINNDIKKNNKKNKFETVFTLHFHVHNPHKFSFWSTTSEEEYTAIDAIFMYQYRL